MSATLRATSTTSDAVTVRITGLPTVRIAFRSTPSPSAAIADMILMALYAYSAALFAGIAR